MDEHDVPNWRTVNTLIVFKHILNLDGWYVLLCSVGLCYVDVGLALYVLDGLAFSERKKLQRGMVALALIEQSNQGSLPLQLDDAAGAYS